MRILIDGDGCPVIDECIKISNKFKIESIIFCDTSHYFDNKNVKRHVYFPKTCRFTFYSSPLTNYVSFTTPVT